jgi:TonB family protein
VQYKTGAVGMGTDLRVGANAAGMSIDKCTVWGETPLKTLIQAQRASSVMAHHPTSARDPSATWAGELFAQPDDLTMALLPETDLQELAAKFASPTGPGLEPDLALDLALQMVLHEIVEEACAATGATGAAIAVYHEGELICRASHGITAPPLGSRLDLGVGLSGECLRTRRIERCNDAETDPRVDFEACSRLGVQSIVVLPLLRGGEIIGIFEVLSSKPSAFGETGMLEALADRILKNLERAVPSSMAPVSVSPGRRESALSGSDQIPEPQVVEAGEAVEAGQAMVGRRWTDVATLALAIVVMACAGWLSVRVVQRFASQKAAVQRPAAGVRSSATGMSTSAKGSTGGEAAAGSRGGPALTSSLPTVRDGSEAPRSTRYGTSRAPEGALRVYENGREVFRLPPSSEGAELAAETGVVRASSVQPEKVLELSARAAESGLIYRVEPEYPEEARAEGIQGAVVLEVRIGSDGSVEQVRVVSGQPVLANAALAAVKQWRFKPRQVNGQAAEMQTTITLNFRLPS